MLMALGLSAVLVGCEPPKQATKAPAAKSGAGSTTGGGAEVPAKPAAGEKEKPAEAPKADEAKADAPKGDKKTDAPKADAKKADAAAPKADAKKADAPKTDKK